MTIAVYIENQWEAPVLCKLGEIFALKSETELLILYSALKVSEKTASEKTASDKAAGEKISAEKHPVLQKIKECLTQSEVESEVLSVANVNLPEQFLEKIKKHKVDLFVAAKNEKTPSGQIAAPMQIMELAPCDVLLCRFSAKDKCEYGRILVPVSGGPHSKGALEWASIIGEEENNQQITALHIQNQYGELAQEVGEAKLAKVIQKAGLEDKNYVSSLVVTGDNVQKTIVEEARKDYDLLLMGASEIGKIRKFLFGTVSDQDIEQGAGLIVGIFREASPVQDRILRGIERLLMLHLPQLSREDRVNIHLSLETGAKISLDFIVLLILSTAIAGLGLLKDNTAVIIGAMLVAPLMTPLISIGLGLTQGNVPLIRRALITVSQGTVFAVFISMIMTSLSGFESVTAEIISRGQPSSADTGIALLSGLAGAYCIGRPGLSAALSGVAIAAALVPPLASIGIALAFNEFYLAAGALTLFILNCTAIVFGSAVVLFSLGVNGNLSRNKWVGCVLVSLVVLLGLFAVFL